jgi:phosphohistidine phosphatase
VQFESETVFDMTILYIFRHAHAGQHGDPAWPDDRVRPLTDKGRKQFRRVTKVLTKGGILPTVIATSPLVRCRQTAEILRERLEPAPELVELEALAPGSDLAALIEWSRQTKAQELAWCGHAPDVDILAAALLGVREGTILMSKGAVVAISFRDQVAKRAGELAWFVSPKILK